MANLSKVLPVIHAVGENDTEFAGVIKGESIRLSGTTRTYSREKKEMVDTPHDLTFKVGDFAEYDSYNYHYIGRITAIGAKTVTIDPEGGALNGKKRRLNLDRFNWRNRNFDEARVRKYNHDIAITL